MKDFKKLMGKKDDESSDMKKDAKLKVLKELRGMASGMMGDDVKGNMMKKVTVAAPDKEGLKKGLDTAEDMIDVGPEGQSDEAAEDNEYMDCTPEELDSMMEKIKEAKARMQSAQ